MTAAMSIREVDLLQGYPKTFRARMEALKCQPGAKYALRAQLARQAREAGFPAIAEEMERRNAESRKENPHA